MTFSPIALIIIIKLQNKLEICLFSNLEHLKFKFVPQCSVFFFFEITVYIYIYIYVCVCVCVSVYYLVQLNRSWE